jgi:hypothetical protein
MKELDILLLWYGIDTKGMSKKAEKVEKWKEIRASNIEPPNIELWMIEDPK